MPLHLHSNSEQILMHAHFAHRWFPKYCIGNKILIAFALLFFSILPVLKF
jgi:hypothetical protein